MKRRRFVTMASDHESPDKNPGLRSGPPDAETKDYFMQQTVYINMLFVLLYTRTVRAMRRRVPATIFCVIRLHI